MTTTDKLAEAINHAVKRSSYAWSRGGSYEREDHENEGKIELARFLKSILESEAEKNSVAGDVLEAVEWFPIEEWHEDDGTCLFIAFKDGEFYDCDWTSPITSTAQGKSFASIYEGCEEIYFRKVRVNADDLKRVRAAQQGGEK